jgi:hypothetical protein
MPQQFLPYQNNSLGLSPESYNQFWQQFALDGSDGIVIGTVASDLSVSTILTSAQLLVLQTTAVQLVAPPTTTGQGNLIPPNGYLYVPTTLTLEYRFGGTAYTIGGTAPAFQIEYTGKTTNLLSMLATGLVDQAANTQATNVVASTGPIISLANSANLGLEVKLAGTTPTLTLGNGTVVLNLLYNLYAML